MEANKTVVRQFLDAVRTRDAAAIDRLLAEDGCFWVIGQGDMTKAQFIAAIEMLWAIIDGPAKVDMAFMTAEEDRVSAAFTGDMVTTNGTPYCNTYHVLAQVRDGALTMWREYFNTVMVERLFAAAAG